ncbi:MAG: dimethyl sulfoxide reductase anchor subunit [Rhodobacteraceae bacterium]|nr:dimethyl sulfoxide reductase anchor subunit [Paracoccaceae bacterium]
MGFWLGSTAPLNAFSMHPALSIILFTTLSGAGLGLAAVIGLFGHPDGSAVVPQLPLLPAAVCALLLTGGGLVCSLFHLRRPTRAWRALSQWRSSWLSREGILAPAAMLALAALVFLDQYRLTVGLILFLLCLGATYATSMIYAQLRAVPAWNTPQTALLFLAFAAAGGLLTAATLASFLPDTPGLQAIDDRFLIAATLAILFAWAIQALWWRRLDKVGTGASTPETATQLGAIGPVRLLEPPHTGSNYLLDEMGHKIARRHATKLRHIALTAGGLIPIALLLLTQMSGTTPGITLLALPAHLAGVAISRWLFFAEARHTVTLYYS